MHRKLSLIALLVTPSCCDLGGGSSPPPTPTSEQDAYEVCKSGCRSVYELSHIGCANEAPCLDRIKQDYGHCLETCKPGIAPPPPGYSPSGAPSGTAS